MLGLDTKNRAVPVPSINVLGEISVGDLNSAVVLAFLACKGVEVLLLLIFYLNFEGRNDRVSNQEKFKFWALHAKFDFWSSFMAVDLVGASVAEYHLYSKTPKSSTLSCCLAYLLLASN